MPLASHWVDDVPAAPETVELDLPDDTDLGHFTGVSAALTDEMGAIVSLTGATFTLDASDGTVVIGWGLTSRFASRGLYALQLTLTGPDGIRQRVAPVRFVVQEVTGWHLLESAREQWPDAPYNDEQLYELLELARHEVIAFLPPGPAAAGFGSGGFGDPVEAIPPDYRKAQLLQARNLWNAAKVDPSNGGLADGAYVISPKPLDWIVRQILRPKRGMPVMF